MSSRIDYDQIAALYDSQPYRDKSVDADLLAFLEERADDMQALAILDIGCGTGNQLIANRAHIPASQMVGLDVSQGMLHQAKKKTDGVWWLQANGAQLPFRAACFDFITNQFAFHHIENKQSVIFEVFRVLRPGGRFVMTNLCPEEMPSWIYYRYFPTARERDLQDFLSNEEIQERMIQVGFTGVQVELAAQEGEIDLRHFAQRVRRRDTCSQLIVISDEDYSAGLGRIDAELSRGGGESPSVPTQSCLVKIIGEKSV